MEESLGSLAQATPALANKLITLALDPKIKGYTAVSAISEAFKILQNGIIDRQNKEELKKIREQLERLEGNPSSFIDVWLINLYLRIIFRVCNAKVAKILIVEFLNPGLCAVDLQFGEEESVYGAQNNLPLLRLSKVI